MRKTALLLFLILLVSNFRTTSQPTTFQVVVDLGSSENACDLQQTPDGGFIVSGMQFTGSTSALKVFLMKFAADGTVQWSKTYSGAVANGANLFHNYRVITTGEGGYLVVGTAAGSNNDIFVMKTDAVGDTVWTRTYGSGSSDDGNSVFEAANGDYIIGSSCVLAGQRRMGFLRIDAAGTVVTQAFHADGIASPWFEYVPLADNEIGIVHSYSSLLAVVDSMGSLQWSMPVGLGSAYSVDASKLPNGEYLVFGLSNGLTGGAYALVRSNSTGNVTLQKKYSTADDESPRNLLLAPNGNYIMFGLSTSMNGPSSLMACEVDSLGNVVWSNKYRYSSNAYHEAGRMIRTSDGGYALLGQYDHSGNYTDFDVYLVKTDSLGQSGCNQQSFNFAVGTVNPVNLGTISSYAGTFTNTGTPFQTASATAAVSNFSTLCLSTSIEAPSALLSATLYPNPSADRVWVMLDRDQAVAYELTDLNGRLLLSGTVDRTSGIDLLSLTAGVYALRLTDLDGRTTVARLIRTVTK